MRWRLIPRINRWYKRSLRRYARRVMIKAHPNETTEAARFAALEMASWNCVKSPALDDSSSSSMIVGAYCYILGCFGRKQTEQVVTS
mmetsp:Transcript_5919/g.10710  ORF Transcript_5919/g.10710 Transcript_5919/m.10710 type:complete len:87 (+) Transcript_5919:427-687(+)